MILDLTPGPLVSTEWLAAHLDDPQLRIVDVRGLVLPPTDPKPHYFARHEDYQAGHIPGAVYIDWLRDIVDLADSVPVQVAPPEKTATVLGQLGIGDDTVVVAYDDHYSMFAGRLLWVLRYYGHEQARILDGGMVKWLAEGRPISQAIPSFAPAAFTPRPQPALRRTADDMLQALNGAELVIDARSPQEYAGLESRAARGGHIPGAINVFYRDLISGPNQTYATADELRARFAAAGIDLKALAEHKTVAYCNGGVSATPVALGLEIASGKQAAIYDGSWNEWGNDPSKPLATGSS
ncbi:MAG: sulfurtransferase [Chloroflexales bacterium]|nr:sulfurtransferase [Chloroflexales bacterium]